MNFKTIKVRFSERLGSNKFWAEKISLIPKSLADVLKITLEICSNVK